VDLCNGIRIGNWRFQAERNPDVLTEALKNFDSINKKLDELKAITRVDADLKAIEDCRDASEKYKYSFAILRVLTRRWKLPLSSVTIM